MILLSECTHDCSSCPSAGNCSSQPDSLLERQNSMSNIKKVVGIVSGKGGVGKSIVTSLLAVMAQRKGYSSAVLDADVTGPSVPKAFGIHDKVEGSDLGMFPVKSKLGTSVMSVNLLLADETTPVVWRGPVISGIVKQFWTDVIWGDVDYMFIDMPPGTGDVPLTVMQSIPLDGIIIVTTPQDLVGMIVEKAVNMAKLMEIPVLGLVENMSYIQCPDCGKKIYPFGESKLKENAEKFGIEVTAALPIEPKLAAACDAGMIELFDGNWLDPVMDNLEKITPSEK